VLAACSAADPAVLHFTCDLARAPGAPRVAVALWVSNAVELLALPGALAEAVPLALVPVILEAVRSSKNPDLQSAGYMALAALAAKATLAPRVVATLLELLPRYAARDAPAAALLALAALCHYQHPASLPSAALDALLRLRTLPAALGAAAAEADVRALAALALTALVRRAVAAPAEGAAALSTLKALLAALPDGAVDVAALAGAITDACGELALSDGPGTAEQDTAVAQLRAILRGLAQRHAAEMDAFIGARLRQARGGGGGARGRCAASDSESGSESSSEEEEEEEEERARTLEFLSHTFAGTAHAPVAEGGTTLLLALEHPEASVRLAAVAAAKSSLESGQCAAPTPLAAALLARARDADAEVALAALGWERLAAHAPPAELHAALADLAGPGAPFNRWEPAPAGRAPAAVRGKVREAALRAAGHGLAHTHPETAGEVAELLLGHLLSNGASGRARRQGVAAVKLAANLEHPLLRGLKARAGRGPRPRLVLSGHAASLTPY
jgi:U3 small nucleolar RNA-associated protein 10